jgi:hypothetical protein
MVEDKNGHDRSAPGKDQELSNTFFPLSTVPIGVKFMSYAQIGNH